MMLFRTVQIRLVQVTIGEMMGPTRGVGEAMAIMQGTIMVSSHHLSNTMCQIHWVSKVIHSLTLSLELTAKTADNYGGGGGGGYDRRDNHGGGGGGGYGNRDSYGETNLQC